MSQQQLKTSPPELLRWNGVLYYLYAAGLYNSFILCSLLAIIWLRVFELIQRALQIHSCNYYQPFILQTELFPALPRPEFIQAIFILFFLFWLIETLTLSLKSLQRFDLKFLPLLLGGWGCRVLLRNLSGLFLYLTAFAIAEAQSLYFLMSLSTLFFIFWGQTGSFQGYSLNTQPARGKPNIKRLFWEIAFWSILLLFMLVLLMNPLLLVMILLFPIHAMACVLVILILLLLHIQRTEAAQ